MSVFHKRAIIPLPNFPIYQGLGSAVLPCEHHFRVIQYVSPDLRSSNDIILTIFIWRTRNRKPGHSVQNIGDYHRTLSLSQSLQTSKGLRSSCSSITPVSRSRNIRNYLVTDLPVRVKSNIFAHHANHIPE